MRFAHQHFQMYCVFRFLCVLWTLLRTSNVLIANARYSLFSYFTICDHIVCVQIKQKIKRLLSLVIVLLHFASILIYPLSPSCFLQFFLTRFPAILFFHCLSHDFFLALFISFSLFWFSSHLSLLWQLRSIRLWSGWCTNPRLWSNLLATFNFWRFFVYKHMPHGYLRSHQNKWTEMEHNTNANR